MSKIVRFVLSIFAIIADETTIRGEWQHVTGFTLASCSRA
jgi:hypothetical protein